MSNEKSATFTVSGPPIIINQFFHDYRSFTGENRKFLPTVIRARQQKTTIAPAVPLDKSSFVEFFGLFLDSQYLASLKNAGASGKIVAFRHTIK
jgi:hypothetical protein